MPKEYIPPGDTVGLPTNASPGCSLGGDMVLKTVAITMPSRITPAVKTYLAGLFTCLRKRWLQTRLLSTNLLRAMSDPWPAPAYCTRTR